MTNMATDIFLLCAEEDLPQARLLKDYLEPEIRLLVWSEELPDQEAKRYMAAAKIVCSLMTVYFIENESLVDLAGYAIRTSWKIPEQRSKLIPLYFTGGLKKARYPMSMQCVHGIDITDLFRHSSSDLLKTRFMRALE